MATSQPAAIEKFLLPQLIDLRKIPDLGSGAL
ncbi:MAG: hypothetical protein ACI9S8_002402 [Chlamydiales bacterium]|jgi:hypothetical protein